VKWFIVALVGLIGCGGEEVALEIAPVDITRAHACALDGMTVIDHHGPKAQILRRDGSRALFCNAREALGELLDPARSKKVTATWLQALDEHPWKSHPDGWVLAGELFIVSGSSKMGSMGPTLAPFVSRVKAEKFVANYGGRIYRLEQIDGAVVEALKRQGMGEL